MTRPRTAARRAARSLFVERLEPRAMLAATDLRITEFLASNDDGLQDADGDASDWIEIYNSGSTTVNLAGLHLTDNANDRDKWTFPAGATIDPGAYLVVFASNKNGVRPGGELHTNFAISADGEYLAIVAADGTTVIDEYAPAFPAQFEDISYGAAMQASGAPTTILANGAQGRAWVPSSSSQDATWRNKSFNDFFFNIVGPSGFGYENNPGDAINFTAEIGTPVPSGTRSLYTRFNFNLPTLAGIDQLTLRMRYDDGFLAYLNGVLVAEANAPESPQWNSQATATHNDNLAEQFVNIDISAFISALDVGNNVLAIHALNQPNGSDMLMSPELVAQAASFVVPERLGYFEAPTPGYGNGANYLGFANLPAFTVPHGYYATTQQVGITSSQAGAVIVYTTNGSTPTVNASLVPTNGTLYTGPINVSATTTLRAVAFKADFKPSFVSASTYLFVNDVINQSPQGQVPPGFAPDNTNGQQMDYGIDPDIIALYGAQAVKDSLVSLPSISITTDLANLFNATTGIYVNALNDGSDWERPASVELINPDGSPGFATNAGLRIRGGYSRNDFNPKHAFRFYFRNEYGDAELNYPMFGAEGVANYDVLDLRAEQNYSWSSEGNVQNTMLREVFSRDLQGDLGGPYTRSRYYHLYLDGVYWGVFQSQERVEENFAADYLGGEPEDYDIVKHGLNDGGGTLVDEGNDDAWFQLFTLAQAMANNPTTNANNFWTLQGLNPDGTRNPALPVLLDVDNLINFMMIVVYTGGFDTGLSRFLQDNESNNWYGVYNRVTADQGFQFFVHDNEHSLGADGTVHNSQSIDRTGPFNTSNQSNYAYSNPQYLHQDLLAHPAYRQRIIEKAQEYFFGNGPMTPAASAARLQERIPQVDPAVIAEAARWGDAQVGTPRNKSTWQTEVNWILDTYFPSRTATVISQLRADGLYATPPVFSLAAGVYPPNTQLTLSAPGGGAGTIYYTVGGADPRLANGNISPSAVGYVNPLSLTADVTIKARFRSTTGAWSVLVETPYTVVLTGDYAPNGFVDGNDFLAWQRNLGAAAFPFGTGADGNRDGTVNHLDLAPWAGNYGFGGSVEVAVASAVVAEPFELPTSALLSLEVVPTNGALSTPERGALVDEVLSSTPDWRRLADDAGARTAYRPAPRRAAHEAAESRDAGGSDSLDAVFQGVGEAL